MAHDASNNNPVKEIIHSLLGLALLFTLIGGIAVSAWLRPAGNHEPATEPATPAGKALVEKLNAIEAPKADEAKADTAQAPKTDDTKAEDTAKADTATQADPAKTDEAKAETKPADTATAEAPKADEAKADADKEKK